jgi:hypothetical protein
MILTAQHKLDVRYICLISAGLLILVSILTGCQSTPAATPESPTSTPQPPTETPASTAVNLLI